MTDPIRIKARRAEGFVDAVVLMPHPMETGFRADAGGQPVPVHHISTVTATVGERTVFTARLSFAVSRDPLLRFRFEGAEPGQRLRVTWTDSRGATRTDEAPIT